MNTLNTKVSLALKGIDYISGVVSGSDVHYVRPAKGGSYEELAQLLTRAGYKVSLTEAQPSDSSKEEKVLVYSEAQQ